MTLNVCRPQDDAESVRPCPSRRSKTLYIAWCYAIHPKSWSIPKCTLLTWNCIFARLHFMSKNWIYLGIGFVLICNNMALCHSEAPFINTHHYQHTCFLRGGVKTVSRILAVLFPPLSPFSGRTSQIIATSADSSSLCRWVWSQNIAFVFSPGNGKEFYLD